MVQTDQLLSFEFRLIMLITLAILIYVLQWLSQLFVKRIASWMKFISRDLQNGIQFSIRFIAAVIVLYLAINLFAVSLESLFGLSAVLGAIISFGSVQWVSNFISGVYILITRPFGVKDFIAINSETSGEVVEISLNYTKVRTIDNIYHIIPNRLFLITNIQKYSETSYRGVGSSEASKKPKKHIRSTVYGIAKKFILEEKVVRYTFNITIPHGDLEMIKFKLQETCDIYSGVFGYKPEFFLMNFSFKLTFRFIVTTHNATILIDNLRDFRNKLLEQFY